MLIIHNKNTMEANQHVELKRGLGFEDLDTKNLPGLCVYYLGQDKYKNQKHNNGSIKDYLTKFGFKIMYQASTGGDRTKYTLKLEKVLKNLVQNPKIS